MAKPAVSKGVLDRLKRADFKEKEVKKEIEEVVVIEKKEYEITAVEKEEIKFSEKNFDYSIIQDEEMQRDLLEYESKLSKLNNKFHTEIGNILIEAHKKYSNNKNGVFGNWLEHIGFNRRTAERLINRSNFIATHCRNINDTDYFETLSLTLTYEVSSPNAPQDLVDAVLNRTISTRKEFVEMKKELLKREEISKDKVPVNFESIINEMKIFNEKYANVAMNIDKIKNLDSKDEISKNKLERVYTKVEKLNKELETLMREIESYN